MVFSLMLFQLRMDIIQYTHTHTHTHTHNSVNLYLSRRMLEKLHNLCYHIFSPLHTNCVTTRFARYTQSVLPLAFPVTHKQTVLPLASPVTHTLCYHIISPLHTLCYHIYFPLHTVGTTTHLCFSLKCLFCCVNIQSIFVDI